MSIIDQKLKSLLEITISTIGLYADSVTMTIFSRIA